MSSAEAPYSIKECIFNTMHPSPGEVSKWLSSRPPKLKSQLLTRTDPARIVILMAFDAWKGNTPDPLRVAVVSGSEAEPELTLLTGPFELTVLSFEEDPGLFDLTADWSGVQWKKYHQQFDLVLCEQVLEHVSDPHAAVYNLSLLVAPQGHLHVSVPAMNNTHGEPYYFYAGFHTRALEAMAERTALTVAQSGSWASDKASRMYATCDWAPLAESGPLRFFWEGLLVLRSQPKRLARTLLGRWRNFLLYPFQDLFPRKASHNNVVSWIIASRL